MASEKLDQLLKKVRERPNADNRKTRGSKTRAKSRR